MSTGILYIVSAASGTGKTSLNRAVMRQLDNLQFSVSYTTRAPRDGERDGVDYHFVSDETFERMIQKNAFLEHVQLFGYSYGTSKEATEKVLSSGSDVILEIDVQGADQIRQRMAETVSVFILPPSMAILRARLEGRKQDKEAVIERRLKDAVGEIARCKEYDYIIVNEDFEKAVEELKAIFVAERCRINRKLQDNKELINDLTYYDKR